jgi:LPS-assembly protein
MIKSGALLLLLLPLPLFAEDAGVLPSPGKPAAVDTMTPVPGPAVLQGEPIDALTPAMPNEVKIDNRGGIIQYDAEAGTLSYGGPVKVTTDTGLELFADRAVADMKAKTVTLTGHVSIYQGNMLQRGNRAVYHWEQKYLDASSLRASVDPILLEANQFTAEERDGKQVFVGTNAGITTNDEETPDFWFRAKRTTVYPGDRVTFENLRIYAGDVPVFWLPYLSQPLDKELGYHILPGATSYWGAYILNTYGIMLGGNGKKGVADDDAWLLSKWSLDLRSRRGVGTGVDLVDTRLKNNPNLGWLKLYYTDDLDPSISRTGLPRTAVNPNRFEAQLKYRVPLPVHDHADWNLDMDLTLLSDRYYLEDFQQRIYSSDPNPDNTIAISRRTDNDLLTLYTRLRINDFYRTDERLPELAFDQARGPIFNLPILHQGSSSLGVYREMLADPTRNSIINPLLTLPVGDPAVPGLLSQLSPYEQQLVSRIRALPAGSPQIPALTTQLLDPGFARFYTYQEFSLPGNIGGWLNVTPVAGFGYTRYWNVSGPESSADRVLAHVGVESSLKFTREYPDINNHKWGIDGLLHVIEPYANWSYVSTNNLDPSFPTIDRLGFSTRPNTIDVGSFTAVDDLKNWNIVRFGARNRLITKRDGENFEWLYLDTYIDAFLADPELNRKFSNLYNDVRWQPLPWLGVDMETQFPIAGAGSGFSEYSTHLRFQPKPGFEFSIGHLLLSNHPVLADSSLLDLRAYARLNENWGVGMEQLWEFETGTLQSEQYSLHRDLGNWIAGMGLIHRNNTLRNEYGVMFTLSLKDFPQAKLPLRFDGL